MNQTTVVTESELQRALDCGELIRLYQPVIDLRTGTPVQVEALLRWDHPGRGLLAPGEFLVDEDDSTLLVRIGWSVVIEAARRAGDVAASVPRATDHGDGEPVRRPPRAARPAEPRSNTSCTTTRCPRPAGSRSSWGSTTFLSGGRRTRDRITILHNLGVEVVVDDLGRGCRGDRRSPPTCCANGRPSSSRRCARSRSTR